MPERILTKPRAARRRGGGRSCGRTRPSATRIVARIAGPADAAPAVRHHHERWDGNGYPDGLAGDDIPIEARIVAAADAYGAMTTDSAYWPPAPPQRGRRRALP